MNISEYIKDPCRASSLPYWNEENITVPTNIRILRDDEFTGLNSNEKEEQFFKLIHHLDSLKAPTLPGGFEIISCDIKEFADHINSCYRQEGISYDELQTYKNHPVYDAGLWIAVADSATDCIAATGIAEYDPRLGEGILEWIQVSPDYRHQKLGSFIVNSLLQRLSAKAHFVTVSGRMDNDSNPFALYRACGFGNPVIWHIISSF